MPKIRWTDLPPSLREHLFDRVADRQISAEDLYKLKLWREAEPEVPEGPWYKDFGSFKICGEGAKDISLERASCKREVAVDSDGVPSKKSSGAIILRSAGRSAISAVMVRWLGILFGTVRSCLRTHRELALENLALRQQLAVWKAREPRRRLTEMDRIFWFA
jgi:hypothetical protein